MIQPRTVTALLLGGLGLCRSVPFVKRLDFGRLPEWCPHGGPSQIGYSLALSPDCLCSASVCCFIQPDGTAPVCLPQHYRGMIASFLAKSLLTANPLGCRGPPNLASEVFPA